MNIKHTPGPWHVEESSDEAEYPFFSICEPSGQFIAPDISIATIDYSGNCYNGKTIKEDKAKAFANARPITPDQARRELGFGLNLPTTNRR